MSRKFSCYILQLQQGKFYVGSTLSSYVQKRFQLHCDGDGAKWCRTYEPIKILKIINNLTSREAFKREDTECVRIMRENNDLQICRGGNYNFPPNSDWWYRLWDGRDGATVWLATH